MKRKFYKTNTKKILASVRKVLLRIDTEELQDNMSIEDVLVEAEVSEVDYYEALSVSSQGTMFILKRDVCNIRTNCYNKIR